MVTEFQLLRSSNPIRFSPGNREIISWRIPGEFMEKVQLLFVRGAVWLNILFLFHRYLISMVIMSYVSSNGSPDNIINVDDDDAGVLDIFLNSPQFEGRDFLLKDDDFSIQQDNLYNSPDSWCSSGSESPKRVVVGEELVLGDSSDLLQDNFLESIRYGGSEKLMMIIDENNEEEAAEEEPTQFDDLKVVQLIQLGFNSIHHNGKTIQIVGGESNMPVDDDDSDDSMEEQQQLNNNGAYQELKLSEEEKRLLSKEGITLPSHYPLTKFEERELKRIRRKIRNKISAQDSRKRKKEYLDKLQQRVLEIEEEKSLLSKKVRSLESANVKLSSQVKRLQMALNQQQNKTTNVVPAATTLLVLILSLALVVLPTNKQANNNNNNNIINSNHSPQHFYNNNLIQQQQQQQQQKQLVFKRKADVMNNGYGSRTMVSDENKSALLLDGFEENLIKIPRFSFQNEHASRKHDFLDLQ